MSAGPGEGVVLDLFAGVGVGVACRDLWLDEVAVENAKNVRAIREANGMETPIADVWDGVHDPNLIPEHEIEWGSPPCQTFTMAGAGAGRKALDQVLQLISERAYLRPDEMIAFGEQTDPRTALVLSPLTYAHDHLPRAIVLEQVPPVLPVWQAMVPVLEEWGYSVTVEVLHAEQYGVPQTRRRAILLARLDGEARMPTPTHSRYYPRDPKRLDPGVPKWVSMAEALGWGMTERPYPAVAAGTEAGGTDPAAVGGSGARKILTTEQAEGRWAYVGNAYPNGKDGGRQRRDADLPAPTITGEHRVAEWAFERPSTTIVGSFQPDIVAAPGYRTVGGYSRQDAPGSIRVTKQEAAALQAFPADFVWPDTIGKGASFQTIGNAVPPLLAKRLLEEVAA